MPITLRRATPADIPEILALVRELAEYEREPQAAVATPELMHRALFGEASVDSKGASVAECIMGEIDGRVQGMALFFMNFSTWKGKAGIYLEDLFVRPASRGKGLGKALLSHLAGIAVERGCPRFEWAVLDWNEPAIGFYRSLGAVPMSEWTVFRLGGESLERLAAEGRAVAR